jgi:hypothetical protein
MNHEGRRCETDTCGLVEWGCCCVSSPNLCHMELTEAQFGEPSEHRVRIGKLLRHIPPQGHRCRRKYVACLACRVGQARFAD